METLPIDVDLPMEERERWRIEGNRFITNAAQQVVYKIILLNGTDFIITDGQSVFPSQRITKVEAARENG